MSSKELCRPRSNLDLGDTEAFAYGLLSCRPMPGSPRYPMRGDDKFALLIAVTAAHWLLQSRSRSWCKLIAHLRATWLEFVRQVRRLLRWSHRQSTQRSASGKDYSCEDKKTMIKYNHTVVYGYTSYSWTCALVKNEVNECRNKWNSV